MADAIYDVIVIGLGGMGSSAAMQLALSGLKVLGLEQFEPNHELGSSHGKTRAIRLAYYENPNYVPLLKRAYHLWHDLEWRVGETLLEECGCLSVAY
ncbi:MAG: FAD-dependent oxidoreductase, partial [Planctomycetota bacterium]